MSARYLIGIDLGTTNCVVAYSDLHAEENGIQIFRIPQLHSEGRWAEDPILPSFLYLAESHELKECSFPQWAGEEKKIVGTWARDQGTRIPTRLVYSAKSWLSNAAAERKEKILPLEAEPSLRVTPLEATAAYLKHICKSWNHSLGKTGYFFEEQEIILTIPASFDEVARTLTSEAARLAEIPRFTFLEEPQAAFYSWLSGQERAFDSFDDQDLILVCDVGGGTTDFSLIEVSKREATSFRRVAVGPHLLLGGENMDAALIHYLETKISTPLESSQQLFLKHQVRATKEKLLAQASSQTLWIPGRGAHIVGGGVSVDLNSEEIKRLLVEGFFGLHPFDQAIHFERRSAIRTMGLPYEREPSITKQLAAFLNKAQVKRKPRFLLFNGGALKPKLFQQRIKDSLDLWFAGDSCTILPSHNLDLAVARGAVYFGKVRRGQGIRIEGGIPRTYYLAVDVMEKEKKALVLLPRGTKEGTRVISSYQFLLKPNQLLSFQLFQSHTRLEDAIGTLIPINEEELCALAPLQTSCHFGKSGNKEAIPVELVIILTEIGTLELWLQSKKTDHKWKLEFQLSGWDKSEMSERRLADETFTLSFLEPAKQTIREAFALGQEQSLEKLLPHLEQLLERTRSQWPPNILRALFDELMKQEEKRTLSSFYQSKLWNLAGFLLRPGVGYPLDDLRIKEIWKWILQSDESSKEEIQIQKWICCRRISAGLSKGQQARLFNELFSLLYDKQKQRFRSPAKRGHYLYSECVRALASFEWVDLSLKKRLGDALLARLLEGNGDASEFWALGRLGARRLLYGTIAHVIPKQECERWVHTLLANPCTHTEHLPFSLVLLGRETDSMATNLSKETRNAIQEFLEQKKLSDLETLLMQQRDLSFAEKERFFGDSLPLGLILDLSH